MQSYQEALSAILQRVPVPEMLRVDLKESLGWVLAEKITADRDLPPFDKSCMDGYALRSGDTSTAPVSLKVVGVVGAGDSRLPRLGPGETAQIMTGAVVPPGADGVQMVEKTRRKGDVVEILEEVRPGEHVAQRGSEVKRNEIVLTPGQRIGPSEIAVLATFGYGQLNVFKSPTVSIFSTGDELVDVDQKPDFGQIRNSNALMLWAQCRRLSLDAQILPCVPDRPERIRESITAGLASDLLILSGGVSMGEYDYVHKVLRDFGVEIFFHKAAVKPGKPLIVGKYENRLIFGLPGNPVSSMVTFEVFAKPAIQKWTGIEKPSPFLVKAELQQDAQQVPGRLFFKPARTVSTEAGLQVEAIETRGSSDIVGFARSDSLLLFPADASFLPAGSEVDVILLEHEQRAEAMWERWLK
jgi:molybdopterin molybdotransferase